MYFPKGKSPKMIFYQLKNIADDRKWFQSQSMHILDMENILLPSIYWQYLKPFIILCNSLFGTAPECDDVSGGKVPSPDSGGGRGGDGTTGNGALGPGVSSPRCPLPPPCHPRPEDTSSHICRQNVGPLVTGLAGEAVCEQGCQRNFVKVFTEFGESPC